MGTKSFALALAFIYMFDIIHNVNKNMEQMNNVFFFSPQFRRLIFAL